MSGTSGVSRQCPAGVVDLTPLTSIWRRTSNNHQMKGQHEESVSLYCGYLWKQPQKLPADSPVSDIFSAASSQSSSSCVISKLEHKKTTLNYTHQIKKCLNGSENNKNVHFGHVVSCFSVQGLVSDLHTTRDQLVLLKKNKMFKWIRCSSTNVAETVSPGLTYLCVKFHFKAEIFGIQSNNVAVPFVQFSLRRAEMFIIRDT